MSAVSLLSKSGVDLENALARIAGEAAGLDADPRFPSMAFEQLALAGVLGSTVGPPRPALADELAMLRVVARADGSVGRILDGHFNAVERLDVAGLLDARTAAEIAGGHLLLGVWGADPAAGEGEPARVADEGGRLVVSGVKTFCSGAGGIDRALVVVRADDGRRLAYVDLSSGVEIDRGWYRGAGLRASESHRVEFDRAPVLEVIGGPDELLREPYFSRDGLRTAATWAGIADRVYSEAVDLIGRRPAVGELTALAVGQMSVAVGTIDRWLDWAAGQADAGASLGRPAIEARYAVAAACRQLVWLAAEACGARPLATGSALDRGRRDLDLFLLQHRLDPLLARHGTAVLEEGRG